MTLSAIDLPSAVEAAKHGNAVMTKCPAHADDRASLAVRPGTDQPVIFYCHAGCESHSVIAAAGMKWSEVCAPLTDSAVTQQVMTHLGPASHIYSYRDEQGKELFQQLRIPQEGGKKAFLPRHLTERGWAYNLHGVRRVLYRLPQIIDAVQQGREVWIVEGEKDADRAAADGLAATTNINGVNGWRTEFGEPLRGCRCTVVADRDKPGQAAARRRAEDLVNNWECEVRIVESPLGKDYAEHRDKGGTVAQFVTTWQSYTEPVTLRAMTIGEMLDGDFPAGREIIPGMLAEGNVLMLVGEEGHGKSTMIRQIAAQCAVGLTPFTLRDMEPLRVLVIDGENSPRDQQIDWRKLNTLCRRHDHPLRDSELTILSEWRSQPDLLRPDGALWLAERVTMFQPHLVCLGPLYRLVGRDLIDREAAQKVMVAITMAQSVCNSAFIVEHHPRHRVAGEKVREMRPYGSTLFLQWPDIGIGLSRTADQSVYDLSLFRGSRNRTRKWPDRVRWGAENTMEFSWEDAGPEGGGAVIQMHR